MPFLRVSLFAIVPKATVVLTKPAGLALVLKPLWMIRMWQPSRMDKEIAFAGHGMVQIGGFFAENGFDAPFADSQYFKLPNLLQGFWIELVVWVCVVCVFHRCA